MAAAKDNAELQLPSAPAPSARHPDSRHKRAKSFFSPLNSFLGLWEAALETAKALLLPGQAASALFH